MTLGWNKEIVSDDYARKIGSLFAGFLLGIILPISILLIGIFWSWFAYPHGDVSPVNLELTIAVISGFLGIIVQIGLFFALRKTNSVLAFGILSSAILFFLSSPFVVLFLFK